MGEIEQQYVLTTSSNMVVLSNGIYVKPEGLKHLSESNYVFSVDNKSISEYYVLNPFWNWVTNHIVPETMAPNTVTFIGFLCAVLAYVLAWLNYPFCESGMGYFIAIPVLMFLYQTLDGCDGKQARRTKSSSPLGELFDHGVDALGMTIFAQSLMTLIGISASHAPILAALTLINMWFSFFTAHWEHYHTDYFFMGYIGACDGQLIIIGLYFTGVYAHWTNPILYPTTVHYFLNNTFIVPFTNWELSYGSGWIAFAHFNGFISVGRCIVAVLLYYLTNGTRDEQREKNPNKRSSFIGAMIDLLPLCILSSTWFAWICINHFFSAPIDPVSPVHSSHPMAALTTVWERDCMWFITTGGLAFGIHLTSINVCRVTHQKFELFSFQNLVSNGLIEIQIVNSLIRILFGVIIVEETLLLRILCITMLAIYLDFVVDIALNFSKAKNIWVFKLGIRNQKNKNA